MSVPSANVDLPHSGFSNGPQTRNTDTNISETDYGALPPENNPHWRPVDHDAGYINIHGSLSQQVQQGPANHSNVCDSIQLAQVMDVNRWSVCSGSASSSSAGQAEASAASAPNYQNRHPPSNMNDIPLPTECSEEMHELPRCQGMDVEPNRHVRQPAGRIAADAEPVNDLDSDVSLRSSSPSSQAGTASHSGEYEGSARTAKNEQVPNFGAALYAHSATTSGDTQNYTARNITDNVMQVNVPEGLTVTAEGGRVNINIRNTNTVQLGNNNKMYVYQNPNGKNNVVTVSGNKEKEKKKKRLQVPQRVVQEQDMEIIADHIGSDWRRLGTQLGLTRGELDAIDHDYCREGLREIIYQMMLRYKSNFAMEATIKRLTEALIKLKRMDVVQKFVTS